MDFLNQVKKTATDVAQKVAQKSGELVEISKIKYEVYDLNSDIKKLYLEIGKLVYAKMRDEETMPEDIRMKCDIVEAKLASIEALKNKEKDLKQPMVCPVCSRECSVEDEVCPYCGADLAVSVDAELRND